MRTLRTKVYKFDELVVDAQQNAIEEFRGSQETYLDFFKESCIEQIEEVGFYNNVKLQYSLGYSQGDGLSFSCNSVNESLILSFFAEILGENKEKTAKIIMEHCSFENKGNNGRYCYASKNDVSFEFDDYSGKKTNIEDIVYKVEEKINDLYMQLCKDLEKKGYDEIEYQQSDEAITEDILANDYEFLKSGKQY